MKSESAFEKPKVTKSWPITGWTPPTLSSRSDFLAFSIRPWPLTYLHLSQHLPPPVSGQTCPSCRSAASFAWPVPPAQLELPSRTVSSRCKLSKKKKTVIRNAYRIEHIILQRGFCSGLNLNSATWKFSWDSLSYSELNPHPQTHHAEELVTSFP